MMRFSARWADTLIADSESTRQDAIRLLDIPSEKILTVPLGVRDGFKPIQSPGILADTQKKYMLPERFILFVGTIEPRKNLPLLLKAYHNLPEQDELPTLVIVGRKGWMYQEVFELVKSLKLENRVHFTGYIPDQDMPIVYNLAHVFVYPSNYEGFGLPPLEAMACGTPVITTAISSMPEHIGSAGILVPPGNEAALTQALHSVLNDSALRQNMTAQGLKRASHFTWKRTAQETLNAYQQALSTN